MELIFVVVLVDFVCWKLRLVTNEPVTNQKYVSWFYYWSLIKYKVTGFFFFNYRIGCMRAWNCLTVSATINGSQTLLLFYSWTRKIFLKKKSKEVLSLFATLNMQVLEGCADTEGVFCSTPNFWCTDREELYNSRASEIFIWPKVEDGEFFLWITNKIVLKSFYPDEIMLVLW